MYYDYFGLSEAPFSIAPNPDYLFMTERHQEALAHLYHSIESDAGFVLLTGEVGTGKTTVCRSFLENLPDDTQVAFILNPFLGARELLITICQELNIEEVPDNSTLRQLTESIYHHLLDNHARGKQTVLLIDEAQHLHDKVLELIRLLTNLETATQKLLKIILVGQPELNDTLEKPELTQLSQRIIARYHIKPLSVDETGSYIDYRLRMAGYISEKKIFPKAIVKKIYSVTHGIPRLINVICDRALLGTYSQNRAVVDSKILNKAIVEVRGENHLKKAPRWIWMTGIAALIIGIYVSIQFFPALDHPSVHTDLSNNSEPENERAQHSESIVVVDERNDRKESDFTEQQKPVEATDANQELLSALAQSQDSKLEQLASNVIKNTEIANLNTAAEAIATNSSPSYYVNMDRAMASLFSSVKKDSELFNPTCSDLKEIGWQCRKALASSWQTVKQYNRPAVIVLANLSGETYYLPVLGLTDTHAEVLTPKGGRSFSLASLSGEWTREFIYLWQPPKNFVNYIYFDSDEDLVDWLANAFAVVDNRDEVLARKNFNSLLKKRVMLFQRENSLTEDGIAGIETLLKLNEKLGIAVTLSQPLSASINSSTRLLVN